MIIGIVIGVIAAFALRRLYYWHALRMLRLKYVDVKACGAIGDGVADDTAAFHAASAIAEANGKIMYVPPGNYKIHGKVRRHR